jgi:hypothetical protein
LASPCLRSSNFGCRKIRPSRRLMRIRSRQTRRSPSRPTPPPSRSRRRTAICGR